MDKETVFMYGLSRPENIEKIWARPWNMGRVDG